MAVPAYAAVGAGFANDSVTTAAVAYPSGISAGDLLLLQVVQATGGTVTTPSGWTLRSGADATPITAVQRVYSKTADGTESGNLSVGVQAQGAGTFARMYRVTGDAAGEWGFEGGGTTNGNDNSAEMPSVTTTGVDRLAVNFLAVEDDNSVGSATGESGGNWTEAVAEFTTTVGNDACLQLQTAGLASAGTISGGSTTISASDPWVCRAFAVYKIAPAITARNVTDTSSSTAATDPTLSGTRTIASGTAVLVALIRLEDANDLQESGNAGTILGGSINGQAFTAAPSVGNVMGDDDNCLAGIWYLLNPTPGAGLSWSFTTDARADSWSVTFVEVVPADPGNVLAIGATNSAVGTSGTNIGGSLTTTEDGALILATCCCYGGDTDPFTSDGGCNELADGASGTSTSEDHGYSVLERLTTTAGAHDCGFTSSASDGFAWCAVEIYETEAGAEPVDGTGVVTLGNAEGSGGGSLEFAATAAATVANAEAVGTGATGAPVEGEAAATLSNAEASAAGMLRFVATGAVTLSPLSAASSGHLANIAGSAAVVLSGVEASGEGSETETFTGTGAAALPSVSAEAAGATADIVGAAAVTLQRTVPETWDTGFSVPEIAYSNGDLTAVNTQPSGAGFPNVRSITTRSSGKLHAEILWADVANALSVIIGLCAGTHPNNVAPGGRDDAWVIDASGRSLHDGNAVSGGPTLGDGGVARLDVDLDSGKLWLGGTSGYHGGGDPAAGTDPTFTIPPGSYHLQAGCFRLGGNDNLTVNFGASAFNYSVPAGFTAWGDAVGPQQPYLIAEGEGTQALAVSGAGEAVLPAVDGAADGTLTFAGAGDITLPATEGAGAGGTADNIGAGAATLANTEAAGQGALEFTGAADATLATAEAQGFGGSADNLGFGAATVRGAEAAGAGDELFAGSGAATVQGADAAGAAEERFVGSVAATLDSALAAGSGDLAFVGAAAPALPNAQADGAGAETFLADGDVELPGTEADGTGTIPFAVVGSAEVDLAAIGLAGIGLLEIGTVTSGGGSRGWAEPRDASDPAQARAASLAAAARGAHTPATGRSPGTPATARPAGTPAISR